MTTADLTDLTQVGEDMHAFVRDLFPICRSLTGPGTRETLDVLKAHLPDLKIHSVPSGTQAFDWEVPPEWTMRAGYILGPDGQKVVDFADHNLHVMGYSIPVDAQMSLAELEPHLYSLPDQPDAIPYVTSYYRPNWGFCLTHTQRQTLQEGTYTVKIDADLKPGELNYGELIIPGATRDEIFLSTYVCHPSMANNELSGPAVTTWLAKWIASQDRRYTYRIVFIPETIGSILYLSQNLDQMKAHVKAGFNISCVGDDRCYSYLESRATDTISDRVAQHVLSHHAPDYIRYSFLERGSDERQYCAPGIDLPIAAVMRSKYGEYPEYHTSLDDLTLVTPTGLAGNYEALRQCLEILEANGTWKMNVLCEPQLGKRGLYPNTSVANGARVVKTLMNVIAYLDGTCDLITLANKVQEPALVCKDIIDTLVKQGVATQVITDNG